MKKLCLLTIVILLTACTKDQKANLQVTGLVKGLRKGTLYLERVVDTSIVVVDSFVVAAEEPFLLQTSLDEAEVLSLRLNKQSKDEEKIIFFAEAGTTDIQTTLKNFAFNAKVSGGKLQDKYAEFRDFMQKFNDQSLDIVKQNFESLKTKNEDSIKAIEARNNNFLKRKYLFATNFAVNNKDLELAPYIAISEIYDANFSLLDTINNAITPRVKQTKYGIQLQEFIDTIKRDSLY